MDRSLAPPFAHTLYGLDIETDTTVDGLDPAVAAIVSVALSGPGFDDVFDLDAHATDQEKNLLTAVDRRLRELPPGVVATWNGAAFDLPFISDRAIHLGLCIGLRLRLDHTIPMRRAPMTGHLGAYRATWHRHSHLDVYRVYRSDLGPALGISCGLKSVARVAGLAPVEVDRARIHELTPDARRAYVASDARLTRLLAERRWPAIVAHIDRLPRDVADPDIRCAEVSPAP